jgi:monooxygenase
MMASIEKIDVLIVGAGLSGIGAGVQLKDKCPTLGFAILEGREASGGTWDLFRYPGVRSDSDMYTLGYSFRPWIEGKAIADGPAILSYIRAAARDGGVEPHIRYGHRVKRATWSSINATWLVEIERAGNPEALTIACNFLYVCGGYYNYEAGYTPEFPGMASFTGRVVHPQKWTPDIDYAGKNVVVIGSGATAMTLVPALTDQAAHVTMLQRSPTYVISVPSVDIIANFFNRVLPRGVAYTLARWKNLMRAYLLFWLSRYTPRFIKSVLLGEVRRALGPDYDVNKHFTPSYNPWDQRLCLIPDADLFKAIKRGAASVVTDQIDTFTATGIKLRSGQELAADVVVTATGLDLLALGGIKLTVDGKPVDIGKSVSYKGMMLADVPNLAYTFGYTNASWTLKSDLANLFVCRLLNEMSRLGSRQCTPVLGDRPIDKMQLVDFSSGYFQRALDRFPVQGTTRPWKFNQNYFRDFLTLRLDSLQDGTMEFAPRR